MADKIQKALDAIGKNLNLQMNVGILAGSTNSDTGESIAPYAAANEFGTLNIPARPFMRNTIAEKSGEWGGMLGKLVSEQAHDAGGIEKAFNTLGAVMVQDIRDSIEHSIPPPNTQSTIKNKRRKGRASPDKTLVDSGSMQRAVAFEIITGESE
ncbi:TPA: hypothetical protein RFB65_001859 [Yersinia enterocolitica]|nr:hypothetical protein [Yersinia enterocolitica]HDU2642874.1 hypothetical protein [Yersinia enterocolitica]HDW8054819.1 hypothetical protein [Yersinia enterocolitica]HEF7251613.1 hypothetical protein [Yersinia enterocolitica]